MGNRRAEQGVRLYAPWCPLEQQQGIDRIAADARRE